MDTAGNKRKLTHATYKRTLKEALEHENTTPYHQMFDLDTGLLKEKYRRHSSPSPPPGTVVFEVGSGRAFVYSADARPKGLHPANGTLENLRKAAFSAQDTTLLTTTSYVRGSTLRQVIPQLHEDTNDHLPPSLQLQSPSGPPATGSSIDIASSLTANAEAESSHSAHSSGAGGSRKGTTNLPTHRAVTEEQQPEPVDTSNQRLAMCNCIALVSLDNIRVTTRKPEFTATDDHGSELSEAYELTAKSPTLRYLRNGYRNYVINELTHDVHKLTGYICRSPNQKIYRAYRTIICKDDHSPQQASERAMTPVTPPSTDEHIQTPSVQSTRRLLKVINQYFNVFATMGDFYYNWPVPQLKGGICNVLIVNKTWVYSSVRNTYLPAYRLLAGDLYTDLAVAEMRQITHRGHNIRYVRFVSSSFTALYTNRQSLIVHEHAARCGTYQTEVLEPAITASGEKVERITAQQTVLTQRPIIQSTGPQPSTSSVNQLPRRLDVGKTVPSVPDKQCDVGSDPTDYRLYATGWPPHEHEKQNNSRTLNEPRGETTVTDEQIPNFEGGLSCKQTLLARPVLEETEGIKNPTLIVYKQNVDSKEPDTLICYIFTEMNLGNQILY